MSQDEPVDIAIIGGGINGCGIARDAAGRGWSVSLCEADDLASGTSSASTKLIHGGLRYLEHHEFRLVREALLERETLWGIAPHIVWPLRFVLPHDRGQRPAWLLRLGLLLYDHLGGRRRLPGTRALDLRRDPAGVPLRPGFVRGFEYSDCWVDDARMVVLNARDAAEHGATIATRTRCSGALRDGEFWTLTLEPQHGPRTTLRARTLVNAAGPWVGEVLRTTLRSNAPARARLVKGSHIVVPRLYPGDQCYVFQNPDGRILFVIPYEQDFSLIGTTDLDYEGDPRDVAASPGEVAYLCAGASRFLRKAVTPDQVAWTYSGVRSLFDDGASAAQEATRDYVLDLDLRDGQPPLLSIYGGKITTYRRLAEAALARLEPHLPRRIGRRAGWTGQQPLPGGRFGSAGFENLVGQYGERYRFLPEPTLRRLVRAYGTCVEDLLGPAKALADLGRDFGAGLTEAELLYLVRREWVHTAVDAVWRRSKLGLRLSPHEIAAIETFLSGLAGASRIAPSFVDASDPRLPT